MPATADTLGARRRPGPGSTAPPVAARSRRTDSDDPDAPALPACLAQDGPPRAAGRGLDPAALAAGRTTRRWACWKPISPPGAPWTPGAACRPPGGGGALAAALAQAQVQEQMGRRLAEALLLREISQMISNSIDLEETLAAVLSAVRRLIPYSSSEICLYDATDTLLQTRAVAGEENFVRPALGRVPAGRGLYRLGRRPRPAPGGRGCGGADHAPAGQSPACRAVLNCTPISACRSCCNPRRLVADADWPDGRAGARRCWARWKWPSTGPTPSAPTMCACCSRWPRKPPSPSSKAQAYRRSRERLDRRLQELTVLQRVGRELNTTWDLERIFDLVTREAVQATGADYASIIQLDPRRARLYRPQHLRPRSRARRPAARHRGAPGRGPGRAGAAHRRAGLRQRCDQTSRPTTSCCPARAPNWSCPSATRTRSSA